MIWLDFRAEKLLDFKPEFTSPSNDENSLSQLLQFDHEK
jgi:hypothetical protein